MTYAGLVLGEIPSVVLSFLLLSIWLLLSWFGITFLPVAGNELTLNLVQSPFGVFAPG